jgi:hypothetical protein
MKTVKVEVSREGVKVLYQGFEGDECFIEASRLYTLLKQYGVEVNIIQSQPTDEYYTTASSREKGVVRGV